MNRIAFGSWWNLMFFGLCSSAWAASTQTGTLMYAGLKSDPDAVALSKLLLSIAVGGMAVQLFYLLSRFGQDPLMPWQRWIGETALGGVTAYLFAASYYTYGPNTTSISLSIFGIFGGFFGQRGIVMLAKYGLRVKNAMDSEKSGSSTTNNTTINVEPDKDST
jgi:hypothetical protein